MSERIPPARNVPVNASAKVHRSIAAMATVAAITSTVMVLARYDTARAAQETVTLTAEEQRGVFAQPRLQELVDRLRNNVTTLFRQQNYALGEQQCQALLELRPNDPTSLYNLACAQARLGRPDDAMTNLKTAVLHGFRVPGHLTSDPDLDSLETRDDWGQLLESASEPFEASKSKVTITPSPIRDGVGLVQESNSVWVPAQRLIHTFFRDDRTDLKDVEIATGFDAASLLLKAWQKEGTAAGHAGVMYDNHDNDHSNLDLKAYPQLARIEYSAVAKRHHLHNGVQTRLHFNGIVIGNSSTAIVNSPFWRSQARLAYTDGKSPAILAAQYFSNHLYFYPEHKDYDPGTNGKGGYGDVFPANTPYVIVSQGSSYSDREFMDAVAATLAAFRPETRERLAQNGALMPCVQMIFRRNHSSVLEKQDYLTGIAHPPVFQGYQINKVKMVEMAHAMQPDNLPPLAIMNVVQEDEFVVGRDYFEVAPREKLFTTPAAIARVCQSLHQSRRMTVSMQNSRDLNGHKLSYHWSVLQGDPNLIQVIPQDDAGTEAELVIQHHSRRRIRQGTSMESSRVDIGIFADNGTYYSAPAIISFYWPENESRSYLPDGRIKSVEYRTPDKGGLYADPAVVTGRNWRDEFRYDPQHRLTGWTRIRGEQREQFTADGHLITELDDNERALKARSVTYSAVQTETKAVVLKQDVGDTVFEYGYDSESDRIGQIVKTRRAETASPSPDSPNSNR